MLRSKAVAMPRGKGVKRAGQRNGHGIQKACRPVRVWASVMPSGMSAIGDTLWLGTMPDPWADGYRVCGRRVQKRVAPS